MLKKQQSERIKAQTGDSSDISSMSQLITNHREESMRSLGADGVKGKEEKDDEDAVITYLWSKWKVWKHIQFNRAYLFRYGFRICDVISRLMILALIWCTLSGVAAGSILVFELLISYAVSIGKYNFFQFLVATYFSEDTPPDTVSYCFVRRMESLIYLVIVSVVILFSDKYNKDSLTDCYRSELFGCNETKWDEWSEENGERAWPGLTGCASEDYRTERHDDGPLNPLLFAMETDIIPERVDAVNISELEIESKLLQCIDVFAGNVRFVVGSQVFGQHIDAVAVFVHGVIGIVEYDVVHHLFRGMELFQFGDELHIDKVPVFGQRE